MTLGEKILIGVGLAGSAGLIYWWLTKDNAAVKIDVAKIQAEAETKLKAGQSRVKTLLTNVQRTTTPLTQADSGQTINQAFQRQ